ncbi:MAG: SprB repeat-containing protein, partial [Saprospiraceae bacterium]|nr:SprB repeat-containing protein [Saprospiraceae bacterium]
MITGTVSVSSNPFAACPVGADTIIIRDTLVMDQDYAPGFNGVIIVESGAIRWDANATLTLGHDAKLILLEGATLGLGAGASCNAQKVIAFLTNPDAKKVVVCTSGLGPETFTFEDVNATGCLTIDGLCCAVSIIAKDNSGKFSDGAICSIGDSVVLLANPSGQLPYTYLWTPVLGDSVGPYTVFPALTTSYSLTLKTTFNPSGPTNALSLQCSTSTTIVVNTPIVLTTVVVPVFCAKDSIGAIDLSVLGGTAPYTYRWSNQATTQDLVKLGAGTYTVTVTDNYGCTATTSVKVLVTDNVPPLIFCPGNAVANTDPGVCTALVSGLNPVIIENCPNPDLSYSLSGATTGSGTGVLTNTVPFQAGITTAVYTVTDGAFTFSCSFKVQVIDTEWPVASNPDTLHVQCPAEVPAPDPSVVQATDNCMPALVTFLNSATTGTGCAQSPMLIRRFYKVSDNAGHTLTVVHVIRVVDTTAPQFGAIPPNSTVDCASIPPPGTPVVTDNCGQNPALSFQEISTQTSNGTCTDREFTLSRTWTAQDACGNQATATQVITVQDDKAPVIKGVPANTTVSCGSIPTPAVLTASDNCDPSPEISFSQLSTQTNNGTCNDQNYTITRIWTATDFCGNSSSAVQVVTVQDILAPTLNNIPASVTVECGNLPAVATPSATDNCDPTPSINFAQTSTQTNNGSCTDQQYTVTRTWTAIDNCGNSSVRTQVISVRDTQAPVLSNVPVNVTVSCTTIPGSAIPGATDNCDPLLSITFSQTSTQTNSGICTDYSYFITRTWSVADNCGNAASKSQLITVLDNQAPVFNGIPANTTVSCNNVPAPATPAATDNCDPAPQISFAQTSTETSNGTCGDQNYTITRTWTAVDKCGNSRVSSQTIVVQDTQAPTLVGVPASVTVDCNAIPAPATPSVTDNCDSTPSLSFAEQTTAGTCSGQQFMITRSWTAVDNCGNSVTATQTITVQDTQPPVLSGIPANTTLTCGTIPPPATPTVLDNCDPMPSLVFNQTSTQTNTGACSDQNYVLVRSWTATDQCGNAVTVSQTISIQDIEAPVFSNLPANLTLQCGAVPLPANPVATDNCDSSPSLSYAEFNTQTSNSSCSDQNYTLTRTWTAADNCGNSSTLTQVLTFQDTQAPMLSAVPGNITVSCTAVPPPATPAVSDACDATPALVFSETSTQTNNGSCSDQNFILSRIWTATDNCGNATTQVQLVTVQDVVAPAFTSAPANITLQCDQVLPPVSTPTASDNCDSTPAISFSETSTRTNNGSCSDDTYTITRTWVVTDNCGNSAQVSQTIAVQDTQAPVLNNIPGNLTVDCGAIPAPATPTATDQCDPAPVISFSQSSSQTSNGACSDQNYTLTRIWVATDRCGNSSSAIQILVVEDNLPPVFSNIPAPLTIQCDQPVPPPAVPTVTDNCDNTPAITLVESSTQANTGDCAAQQYTITRIWTATDNCGHTTSAVQTITVQDTQPPVFTGVPANSTAECGNVPAPGNPVVVDNCDPAPVLSFSEVSNPSGNGCIGQNYTITRTWTALDHCGNMTTATQIISLQDTQAPVFTGVPAPITILCDAAVPPVASPLASDNCDNSPSVSFAETSTQTNNGSCTDLAYSILRTWTAVDDCGNASTVSQTITVVDVQAPVFTAVPAPVTLSCEEPLPAVGLATATDNCSSPPVITYAESNTQTSNGTCSDLSYTVVRLWTATDRCGNTATASQSISVLDAVPPVLTGIPAAATVSCDAIPAPVAPGLSDNCDPAPTLSFVEQGLAGTCSGQQYTLTRIWTATDKCGNSTSAVQVLTIEDQQAPVFSNVPANISLDCEQPIPGAAVVTITDNCDPTPTLSFVQTSSQTSSGGCGDLNYTITRSWTATDQCGNVSTMVQTIVVADTQPPVFAGVPLNITIACGAAVPPVSSASVTDNCDPTPALSFTEVSTQTSNGSCTDLSYSVTRTWTASDLCGNMAVTTQFILVQDQVAPVFSSMPANITLDCDAPIPTASAATATDNCDPSPTLSFLELSTQTNNGTCTDYDYILTRSWTATDKCGNAATTTQIVVVQDNEAPVFAGVPANVTLQCGQPLPNDQPGSTVDNCDTAPAVSYTQTSTQTNTGDCSDFSYNLTRNWTATDKCGNATTVSQLVVVQDTQAPVLSGVPANLSVTCTAVPAPAVPVVSDNCDPAPGLVFSEISTQSNNGACTDFNYTISRTWVATDRCGNSTLGLQVIFVVDTEAPVFTNVPDNITAACDAIPALATPSVTDNCDPAPVLTFTEQNNLGDCSAQAYSITRTWIATDRCGNSTVVLQTIVVEDNLAPVFSNVPGNLSFECDAVNIPAATTPTVADNCDNTPTLTFSEVSSQGLTDICSSQQYSITRTWTASDDCGNTATAVQVISVLDTQKPVFEVAPANITIACDQALPPTTGQVVATDNCDPEPSISVAELSTQTSNGNCTDFSYVITRIWTATDNCGNSNSVSQTIAVSDTQPPVFSSIPANLTLECSEPLPLSGSVTATDNCDAATVVSFSETSTQTNNGTCTDANYVLTRSWLASDACGNTAVVSQTITVRDSQGPVFGGVPPNLTLECNQPLPAAQPASVTDNCDSNPAVSLAETSTQTSNGSCTDFSYTITRTWTAIDQCGNTSTAAQTLTVTDTQQPAFAILPANLTIQCGEPVPTVPANAVSDNCDPAPVLSFNETSTQTNNGSCSDLNYTVTRTWIATDRCGNSNTVTQVIAVQDLQAPVFGNIPGNTTVECGEVPAPPTPQVTDNCDDAPALTFTDLSNQTFNGLCTDQNYTITRTWTATDKCGNATTATQLIEVKDTEPPVLSGVPGNLSVECGFLPGPASPVAVDNCNLSPSITFSQTSTQTNNGTCTDLSYTITRTWVASDNCGNTTAAVQVISVADTTPPVLSGVPANTTLDCSFIPPPEVLDVIDICDFSPELSFSETSTQTNNGSCTDQNYEITRTWVATDRCGNSSFGVQVITILDFSPPVISNVPPDSTVPCDAVPAPAAPSVADNCDNTPVLTFVENTGAGSCADQNYTITRTWTAVDNCGNITQVTQILTVEDNVAPELQGLPDNLTVACDQIPPPTNLSATDNCDPAPEVTLDEQSTQTNDGTCSDLNYTIVRTWTALDNCGNEVSATQTIVVEDTEAPEFLGLAATLTVECSAVPPVPSPLVVDKCDVAPAISFEESSTQTQNGTCTDQNYTLTRTWTASDRCGNSAIFTQTITVQDTQAPQIACPANLTVNTLNGDTTATGLNLAALVTDNCNLQDITYVLSGATLGASPANGQHDASSETYQIGLSILSYTASDACGNTQTCSSTVSVNYTPPDVHPAFIAETDLNACNQTVAIDITAIDFKALGTVQFSIDWDPALLKFDSVGTFHPNLQISTAQFGLGSSSSGRISFSWTSPTPVFGSDIPDGALVFRLYFSNLGTIGNSVSISFGDVPLSRQLKNGVGALVPGNYIDGQIQLNDNLGPELSCPPDTTVLALAFFCTAQYTAPAALAVDYCSGVSSLLSDHPDTEYPAGTTLVTY